MESKSKQTAFVRAHFSQRCYQRVGYVISQEFLLEELSKGNLTKCSTEENGRIRYFLKRRYGNKGKGFIIVYDPEIKLFVTVIPNKFKTLKTNDNKEDEQES